jgi:hypothetical protein
MRREVILDLATQIYAMVLRDGGNEVPVTTTFPGESPSVIKKTHQKENEKRKGKNKNKANQIFIIQYWIFRQIHQVLDRLSEPLITLPAPVQMNSVAPC